MSRVSSLELYLAVFSLLFLGTFLLFGSRTETLSSAQHQVETARKYVEGLQAAVSHLESLHLVNRSAPVVLESVSHIPVVSNEMMPLFVNIDPDFERWKRSLSDKLYCHTLLPKGLGFYQYHMRKAAGTSVRDMIKTHLATILKRPITKNTVVNSHGYFETEGVVLHSSILDIADLISVISLRHPIERILSLYWYEHVGWFAGVLKKPERCKSLRQWTTAWLDGGECKNAMLVKFPDNNYIEIENYYVKALSGHMGNSSISRVELDIAKANLRKFDLVFITEWLGDSSIVEALNELFPGRAQLSLGRKVSGDFKLKERLHSVLAQDQDDVRKLLTEKNALDLELYEYAQSLVALRIKQLQEMVSSSHHQAIVDSHQLPAVDPTLRQLQHVPSPSAWKLSQKSHQSQFDATGRCSAMRESNARMAAMMSKEFKSTLGMFQPPGHKGPL